MSGLGATWPPAPAATPPSSSSLCGFKFAAPEDPLTISGLALRSRRLRRPHRMRPDFRRQQATLFGNADRMLAAVEFGRAAISVPIEFRFAELMQLAVEQVDLEHVGFEPLEEQEFVAKNDRLWLVVRRL